MFFCLFLDEGHHIPVGRFLVFICFHVLSGHVGETRRENIYRDKVLKRPFCYVYARYPIEDVKQQPIRFFSYVVPLKKNRHTERALFAHGAKLWPLSPLFKQTPLLSRAKKKRIN